jgi:hypothetical protein
LRALTIPPREMTLISVVSPSMSTIILSDGSSVGSPTLIAAAMGSSTICTVRAPALYAVSRTADTSTGVIPLGTPMTTRDPNNGGT